jgi:hypothetical protein
MHTPKKNARVKKEKKRKKRETNKSWQNVEEYISQRIMSIFCHYINGKRIISIN